jgi:hypothetical protein
MSRTQTVGRGALNSEAMTAGPDRPETNGPARVTRRSPVWHPSPFETSAVDVDVTALVRFRLRWLLVCGLFPISSSLATAREERI